MAQGDITVKINYAASATPTEAVVMTDTNQTSTMLHTSIDKSIGGGKEISCGATATNVFYEDYTTTTTTSTTLTSIVSTTPTGIDFLMVKIREAVDEDGDSDCSIEISGTVASKLIGDGDVCILRLPGLAGTAVEIFSTAGKLAKVDILFGIES